MPFLTENRSKISQKYQQPELLADIDTFITGSGKLSKVLNHFFEEAMFVCSGPRGTMSPMQALSDDTTIRRILDFTQTKPKVFTGDSIRQLKTFFRIAGKTAQKVANFPVREAAAIIEAYCPAGGRIYDPSAGFGSRMSAAVLTGRYYCATEPNSVTYQSLEAYAGFLDENFLCHIRPRIYNSGSEIAIPELVDTVDMCFTSPPYFNLETYGMEASQSTVRYPNYEDWLENFVRPTVVNCRDYLVSGGILAINIKNLTAHGKRPLFDDWYSIVVNTCGLLPVETISMKQLSRKQFMGKHHSGVATDYGNVEPVMIFLRD